MARPSDAPDPTDGGDAPASFDDDVPAPATAPPDPPTPPPVPPASPQPKGGPPDVAIKVVIEARGGSPAAFATLIEHWDPHLRTFVHSALAGDGSTDRVLAASYVRAYRALPRYQADRTPGLWLHRVAYLAVLDELRRQTRDPLRRKGAPTTRDAVMVAPAPVPAGEASDVPDLAPDGVLEPRTVAPASATAVDLDAADPGPPVVTDLDHPSPERSLLAGPGSGPRHRPSPSAGTATDAPSTTLRALRRLASDQRAMLVMVDLERFSVEQVADVFDTTPPVVRARLGIARRVVLGGQAAELPNDEGPEDREAEVVARSRAVGALLGALEVPPPDPAFWSDLGTRLIAERDSPAAPPPDPLARLNPPHPAEPGFHPDEAGRRSVTEIAGLADRTRPGRPWGRYLLVGLGVVALVAAVVGVIRFGISERTPDGTISAEALEAEVRPTLAVTDPLRFRAEVESPESGAAAYSIQLGDNGSWSVTRTDTLDVESYDGRAGVRTKIALADGASGQPEVRADLGVGLPAGPPDPGAPIPSPLADLQAVGPLLRSDPDGRAERTRDGDTPTWTYERTDRAGADGPVDRWTVVVRRSDGVVVSVALHRDGTLVRRTRYADWTPDTTLPDGTFLPAVPDGVTPTSTNAGFTTGDIQSAQDLGRGEAITPRWLPDGFSLATVTVRKDPVDGATSTGAGRNPADRAVLSLGYQRGPERITVTMRDLGSDPTAWEDPFHAPGEPVEESGRVIGDGQFNGARVTIDTDTAGRASLWGAGPDTFLTVSGDLTAEEAYRLASSLR